MRARAERPGWGRWEQLAWSDLAPAEQAAEPSGEKGGVAASSAVESPADALWSPRSVRSPPGFDKASIIDGLRQSLLRSPSHPGAVVSASSRDERRDERRRSSGDDVVATLVSKLRGKNEAIAELQAAVLEGARRSSEVEARAGRAGRVIEALQGRLERVEAARAKELAGIRDARRQLRRRQEAVARREEALAAGEVAQGALGEAQALATRRCWAAELREAEALVRSLSARARAAEAESVRLKARLQSRGIAELQGKLALSVRAHQSAVARAEAQARARAAAERAEAAARAAEAAARADLGALHLALASHGIELHYEPG